nr:transposase [Enterococcus sp. 4G2_DIV0659]
MYEIRHALELPYSNGPLECLNNHIKVLKRNAYGFRNFYNFNLRITLCFGTVLFQPNRKSEWDITLRVISHPRGIQINGGSRSNPFVNKHFCPILLHYIRFHSLDFLHQH